VAPGDKPAKQLPLAGATISSYLGGRASDQSIRGGAWRRPGRFPPRTSPFAHIAKLSGASCEPALSFFPLVCRERRVAETIDRVTRHLPRFSRSGASGCFVLLTFHWRVSCEVVPIVVRRSVFLSLRSSHKHQLGAEAGGHIGHGRGTRTRFKITSKEPAWRGGSGHLASVVPRLDERGPV
jgi:hypothetical protein